MSRALKYTTAVFYLFLILLLTTATVGSYLGDIASRTVYLLGAAAILVFAVSVSRGLKRQREEDAGVVEVRRDILTLDLKAVRLTAPLVAPVVGLIFLVSYLTSLVLWSFGITGAEVEILPPLDMIVIHALIPSLVEEAIFRFVPMLLLAPYSGRWCVVISSVGFALVHLDLFQIPYALVAGVLLMGVNLICDSVWPSVIIHFLNNTLSVVWISCSLDGVSAAIYVSVLVALSLIGIAAVLVRREKYITSCRSVLGRGESCGSLLPFFGFVAVAVVITVTNLLV